MSQALNKTTNVLITTKLAQSNAMLQGVELSTEGKLGGMLYVKYGRTTIGSIAATVFRLEARFSGTNEWVDIATWTTAFHGFAALAQTLTSNAAAGATTIQLSAGLGSALSTPLVIFNSAAVSLSEWNRQQQASTNPALAWSLNGAQTTNVAIALSYAEMFAVPIDLQGVMSVRMVVDNVWNAAAAPVIVRADLVTTDSIG